MSIRICMKLFKNFSPKQRNIFLSAINQNVKQSTDPFHQKIMAPKEIYYGILTPQVKAVKFFSLSSSMVGIMAQPFLFPALMSSGNVPIIVAAYSFIGFFTFVTPLLLHLITKKYVTHLIYNPMKNTYTAKTVNFFCITREIEFTLKDVKVPEVPGMFTTLTAKGKPMFFDPKLFTNPEHYIKLMGYDKPIDLKMFEGKPLDKRKE